MEYCWSLFNNSSVRGHNGNCSPNHAWDQDHWNFPTSYSYPPQPDSSVSEFHAPNSHFFKPDPHLTCLKLGKRNYFEDGSPPLPAAAQGQFSMSKKGKSYAEAAVGDPAAVPRCQVEGCAAVLVNAKDYHRRHKVCEMHAKAPRVVVLGVEQRFCQQCSRFHAVGEFDEAKRSCRRRLAGHNERRRKSSQEQNALARRHSQEIKMMGVGRKRESQLMNNSECALSLLSSNEPSPSPSPWNFSTSPDLPARCSAALRELIAENRASRQLNQIDHIRAGPNPQAHVTLNLMQAPNSAFGLLSVHDHHKSNSKDDQHCSDLWKLPLGY